jgi:peroxiredoxin
MIRWEDCCACSASIIQVLSDPANVARACGVLSPTGLASRWAFLIGADGRIPGIDKRVSPARHGRDVAEALKSACRTVN